MSRGSLTFKQKDVTRAVKAVTAAGIEVARVEVDKAGKIVIVAGKPGEASGESEIVNDLDTWLAKHAGAAKGH
jgi:hypothetical protein